MKDPKENIIYSNSHNLWLLTKVYRASRTEICYYGAASELFNRWLWDAGPFDMRENKDGSNF